MRYFVSDFETTVYDGQKRTDVWATATVEFNTEKVAIYNNIDVTFAYWKMLAKNSDIRIYFHNLKFDGSFVVPYLFEHGYKLSIDFDGKNYTNVPPKLQKKETFSTLISDKGIWYSVRIKLKNGHTIELLDSYKLIPFSVENMADGFNTKHKKLVGSIDYEKYREPYGEITDTEKKYIRNDVLVVKEVLEIFYEQNHTKMTIGSNCMKDFKTTVHYSVFKEWFPNLDYEYPNTDVNIDEYIRDAYHGGWCHVDERYKNRVVENGVTLDVNSLYPFECLSSEVGQPRLPVGEPIAYMTGDDAKNVLKEYFNDGKYKPPYHYLFVNLTCNFSLKKDHLPFIQKKDSWLYKKNENLKTSLIWDSEKKRYVNEVRDHDGKIQKTSMTMTMTYVDFKRFYEFYDIFDLQINSCMIFMTELTPLNPYINKWKDVKENSEGPIRTIAKLFSNNLYGKLASGKNSSFKVPYMDEDGVLRYHTQEEHSRNPMYIPMAAAITSHARDYTIRHAQKNYKYFCYSDTDSIHLCCDLDQVVGVEIHNSRYGAWKCEKKWQKAIFCRQKTYIEIEDGEMDIKACGMNDQAKELLRASIEYDCSKLEEYKEKYPKYLSFVTTKRDLTDFRSGLTVPGKFVMKTIPGGTLLTETTFQMK